jgi:hypothetical protein
VLERERAAGRLHCWSYHGEFWDWLKECRSVCCAPKIQNFLTDFMAYTEVTFKAPVAEKPQETNL